MGCLPLCPNRLSYPELYPSRCLYRTEAQLLKTLRRLASSRSLLQLREERRTGTLAAELGTDRFRWAQLQSRYALLFKSKKALKTEELFKALDAGGEGEGVAAAAAEKRRKRHLVRERRKLREIENE